MEYTFHYLLMANQAIFHREVLALLKDTKLTLGQPKVLDYLMDHDGAGQKEIARGCHIEPASLTVTLNGMEEKGLVRREIPKEDRRSSHVFLTPLGREMLQKVEEAFLKAEASALSSLSPQERTAFLETFGKIYENLKGDLTR